MGPPSMNGGRRVSAAPVRLPDIASMGPPSMNGGRLAMLPRTVSASRGFNGAAVDERRKAEGSQRP